MARQNNITYPLDRRILGLIVKKADAKIDVDNVNLNATCEYRRVAKLISDKGAQGEDYNMSYQTLKRVFGHTKNKEGKPMTAQNKTLNAIACFLGAKSWNALVGNLDMYEKRIVAAAFPVEVAHSQKVNPKNLLTSVRPKDHVEIVWEKEDGPARVKLECIGRGRYRVNALENCSLEYGDELKGVDCYKGFPLRVAELIPRRGLAQRYEGTGRIVDVQITRDKSQK